MKTEKITHLRQIEVGFHSVAQLARSTSNLKCKLRRVFGASLDAPRRDTATKRPRH